MWFTSNGKKIEGSYLSLCNELWKRLYQNHRDDGTVIPSVPWISCNVNDWDKGQYCHCPNGQRISVFRSEHSNHHEDRKWRLKCQAIPTGGRPLTGNFSASEKFFHFEFWLRLSFRFFEIYTFLLTGLQNGEWISGDNDWDSIFNWNGRDKNAFLIGMQSHHDNYRVVT